MSKNPYSVHGALIEAANSRSRDKAKYDATIMDFEQDREDNRTMMMIGAMKYFADSMVQVTKTFSDAITKQRPPVTINIYVQNVEDVEKAKNIIGDIIEK